MSNVIDGARHTSTIGGVEYHSVFHSEGSDGCLTLHISADGELLSAVYAHDPNEGEGMQEVSADYFNDPIVVTAIKPLRPGEYAVRAKIPNVFRERENTYLLRVCAHPGNEKILLFVLVPIVYGSNKTMQNLDLTEDIWAGGDLVSVRIASRFGSSYTWILNEGGNVSDVPGGFATRISAEHDLYRVIATSGEGSSFLMIIRRRKYQNGDGENKDVYQCTDSIQSHFEGDELPGYCTLNGTVGGPVLFDNGSRYMIVIATDGTPFIVPGLAHVSVDAVTYVDESENIVTVWLREQQHTVSPDGTITYLWTDDTGKTQETRARLDTSDGLWLVENSCEPSPSWDCSWKGEYSPGKDGHVLARSKGYAQGWRPAPAVRDTRVTTYKSSVGSGGFDHLRPMKKFRWENYRKTDGTVWHMDSRAIEIIPLNCTSAAGVPLVLIPQFIHGWKVRVTIAEGLPENTYHAVGQCPYSFSLESAMSVIVVGNSDNCAPAGWVYTPVSSNHAADESTASTDFHLALVVVIAPDGTPFFLPQMVYVGPTEIGWADNYGTHVVWTAEGGIVQANDTYTHRVDI